jgi:beta-N-acetylhexosaminidase
VIEKQKAESRKQKLFRRIHFCFLLSAFCFAPALLGADARGAKWVDQTLKSLSTDEKIGQLLMPGNPLGAFRNVDSEEFQKIVHDVVEFHAGGFHVFGGDPAAVALIVNEVQRRVKVPLLVADNFEGGVGYVLFGATRFPLGMAMGATGDPQLAYQVAKYTAEEGKAIGVRVNFYPVADVQNNPANPIINIRSFGEDPESVSKFVRAYIKGAQDNGQLATAKHFPGHGDVATDSHLQMPVLDVSRERLEKIEFPPFRAAVAEDVGAFMTAHIWLPEIESEKGLPSTLSKTVLTDILRGDLKFKGLIFTDAMSMRGVSLAFEPGEAAVRAIEAGADMLVLLPDVEAAFNGIKAALASGRLTQARIDQAVRQVLEAKVRVGLDQPKNRLVDVNAIMNTVATKEHRDFARDVAERAMTLVRDEEKVLPLKPSPDTRVVQINVVDSRTGWREGPPGHAIGPELQKRFPKAVTVQIDDQSTPFEFDDVRRLATLGDTIVVNAFIRIAAYKGSIALTPPELQLIRDLIALKKPFVFTIFGSPYLITQLPELPSYVVAYDTNVTAEVAAVRTITGEVPFRGHLPINLPGLYKIGDGITDR